MGYFDGLLSQVPGYDPQSYTPTGAMPDQHNRSLGYVGQLLGALVGGFFGGQPGAMGGGMIGKKAGYGFGNIFAGRDAFNGGTGDFWDNFNPFSKNGAASIGQSLNIAQMPQTMLGRMGGMGGMGAPGLLPMGI